jgi:hypothetical protein
MYEGAQEATTPAMSTVKRDLNRSSLGIITYESAQQRMPSAVGMIKPGMSWNSLGTIIHESAQESTLPAVGMVKCSRSSERTLALAKLFFYLHLQSTRALDALDLGV